MGVKQGQRSVLSGRHKKKGSRVQEGGTTITRDGFLGSREGVREGGVAPREEW